MSYQRRKIRVGKVVGDTMNKTRIVEVEWRSFHRVYKKSVRRRTRFKVHDENNTARLGDTVTIVESRPMSKTKRWRLVEIVERRRHADVQLEDIAAIGAVDLDATQSPPVEHPSDQEERYDPDAAAVGQEEMPDGGEAVGQTDKGEVSLDQEEVSDGAEAVGQTDMGEVSVGQEEVSDGAEAVGQTDTGEAPVGQEEMPDGAEAVGQTDTGEAPVGQEEMPDGAEAVGQTDTDEVPVGQEEMPDGAEAIGGTEHGDAVGQVEADKGSPAEEGRSEDLRPADPGELQSESLASPPDSEEDGREEKASDLAAPASESEDDNIQGKTPAADGSAADRSQEEKPRQ